VKSFLKARHKYRQRPHLRSREVADLGPTAPIVLGVQTRWGCFPQFCRVSHAFLSHANRSRWCHNVLSLHERFRPRAMVLLPLHHVSMCSCPSTPFLLRHGSVYNRLSTALPPHHISRCALVNISGFIRSWRSLLELCSGSKQHAHTHTATREAELGLPTRTIGGHTIILL